MPIGTRVQGFSSMHQEKLKEAKSEACHVCVPKQQVVLFIRSVPRRPSRHMTDRVKLQSQIVTVTINNVLMRPLKHQRGSVQSSTTCCHSAQSDFPPMWVHEDDESPVSTGDFRLTVCLDRTMDHVNVKLRLQDVSIHICTLCSLCDRTMMLGGYSSFHKADLVDSGEVPHLL